MTDDRPFTIWNSDIPSRSGVPQYRYRERVAITIYALVDPFDESVRYVGVTRDPHARMVMHKKRQTNPGMRLWFTELKSIAASPRMVSLGRCHPSHWEKAEQKWIKWFRKRGRLYNLHHGGVNKKYAPRLATPEAKMKPSKMRAFIDPMGIVQHVKVRKRGKHRQKKPRSLAKLSPIAQMNAEVRAMLRRS